MNRLFTERELQSLRLQYGRIKTIDPTGPARLRMQALVRGMPHKVQVQLAGADVRWLSYEANRAINGEPLIKPNAPEVLEPVLTDGHHRDNGRGFL